MTKHALARLERCVREAQDELGQIRISGSISEVTPAYARVAGLSRFLKLGECVSFSAGGVTQLAEVVRIDGQGATVKTFNTLALARLGERVYCADSLRIFPDQGWKGRVVNALGSPIDAAGPLQLGKIAAKLDASPPPAMCRARVQKPLKTGVRVMDLFTPICAGQRIGIFAGSGVGKSTLLAMLAGSRDFDTVVIALVGERGREVREFLDDALALNRSLAVAVVATGDESPVMRRLAPKTAMSIAEFYRDQGESVLLIIDSITRFAHAARDVAMAFAARSTDILSSTAPSPTRDGFRPSTFLPRSRGSRRRHGRASKVASPPSFVPSSRATKTHAICV